MTHFYRSKIFKLQLLCSFVFFSTVAFAAEYSADDAKDSINNFLIEAMNARTFGDIKLPTSGYVYFSYIQSEATKITAQRYLNNFYLWIHSLSDEKDLSSLTTGRLYEHLEAMIYGGFDKIVSPPSVSDLTVEQKIALTKKAEEICKRDLGFFMQSMINALNTQKPSVPTKKTEDRFNARIKELGEKTEMIDENIYQKTERLLNVLFEQKRQALKEAVASKDKAKQEEDLRALKEAIEAERRELEEAKDAAKGDQEEVEFFEVQDDVLEEDRFEIVSAVREDIRKAILDAKFVGQEITPDKFEALWGSILSLHETLSIHNPGLRSYLHGYMQALALMMETKKPSVKPDHGGHKAEPGTLARPDAARVLELIRRTL